MSDLVVVPGTVPAPPTPRWNPATRLAFRLGFCYLMLYALGCGNATIWEVLPFGVGEHLEDWTAWPFSHGAQWLGQHLFHLTGVGARLHRTGSGDTILDWIAVGIMLILALLAALLWTAFDELRSPARRPVAYPRLFFWFRLILRLTLGYALLSYGLVKLFPLQMPPPSLAVLNEPLGHTSPMTMLWTLIGLNPIYERICGAAEVAAGVLVLFRRTALLGALLGAFLTTNIVLYNFCYDVPVKIYAAHLLLISLALLAPELRGLFDFFILHRPATPIGGWTRPARRYGLRVETLVTAVVLLLVTLDAASQFYGSYRKQQLSQLHPPAWVGQWHIDSAQLHGQPRPLLTGDGLPATDFFLEPSGRTMLRDSSTVLWRASVQINPARHTLSLSLRTQSLDHPIVYALAQPDADRMLLTPTGKDASTAATLQLTRVPLPAHYPLLERGFHFVNEWGLER